MTRTRGRKLQALRKRVFDEFPLCARCQQTIATELDHISPISKGGTDSWDNLQGLCHDCHVNKTAEDMGAVSFDADGLPLGGHFWNK